MKLIGKYYWAMVAAFILGMICDTLGSNGHFVLGAIISGILGIVAGFLNNHWSQED